MLHGNPVFPMGTFRKGNVLLSTPQQAEQTQVPAAEAGTSHGVLHHWDEVRHKNIASPAL